jgi:hypothetical protein
MSRNQVTMCINAHDSTGHYMTRTGMEEPCYTLGEYGPGAYVHCGPRVMLLIERVFRQSDLTSEEWQAAVNDT